MGLVVILFYLAFIVFMIAANWTVYTKAGKPGWACLVPIYNIVVLLEIVGKPTWWFVLMLVPVANIIVAIIMWMELAKVFGKGSGFGLGLIFLGCIFMPILAFGSAQYVGAAGAAVANRQPYTTQTRQF